MSKGSNKDNIIRTENGTYIVRIVLFYFQCETASGGSPPTKAIVYE